MKLYGKTGTGHFWTDRLPEQMNRHPDFDLYLITDRQQVKGNSFLNAVEKALQGGVKAIQLREKDLCARDAYDLALELRRLTRLFNASLLINDRIDIALAVDADGVHLTETSLPVKIARKILGFSKLIGASRHTLEGAKEAETSGADFITFGPVFLTPSKAAYGPPVGPEKLAETASALNIPVFGLGGVKKDNIPLVIAAKAHGIAMISEILASVDPGKAAAEIIKTLEKCKKEQQS